MNERLGIVQLRAGAPTHGFLRDSADPRTLCGITPKDGLVIREGAMTCKRCLRVGLFGR